MCLTGSSTSDDSTHLTNGIKQKLLSYSRNKQSNKGTKKLPRSRPSSGVERSSSIPKRQPLTRLNSNPKGLYEKHSDPMTINILPSSSKFEQSADMKAETAPKQHSQSVFVSAAVVGKMKAKQGKGMKGMISGMGKEIKRVATNIGDTVQEHIPNANKKNKASKDRQLLMGPETPKMRNPAEIKKAYGYPDVTHAAEQAHDKLQERGKKLTAIQHRTGELENEAANFASLAQELTRKMENKKWYEI